MREPVGAAVGVVVLARDAGRREPVRPLPAEARAPDRAGLVEPVVAGRGLGQPAEPTLFHRIVVDEDVLVGFLVLDLREILRDDAEAPRIDADHVDGGLAVDDPLGKLPARAAGRGHAEAVAFGQPEILQAESRADHRVAVGRVGDRAVDDILDAGVLEARHPLHAGLDMGQQPVELAREKVFLEGLGHAVDEAGRRVALIGAEDPAHPFLAQIIGGVGFPEHGEFGVAGVAVFLQHRIDIGHDILVLDRDRRNFQADHPGRGARIVAGRAHDMFAADIALVGPDDPLAFVALDPGDRGVLVNLRAAVARALRHRHGDIDRRDMAVRRMPQGADQSFGVDQRPELLYPLDIDNLAFDAYGLRRALVEAVFVHAVAVGREAQVAVDVEADVLAGLRLERLVQVDRILVKLADRIAHVEQRQQAGGMPGRSGGQFRPLDQHGIGPAFLGQMIQGGNADNAATDHDGTGLVLHPRGLPISAARRTRRRPLQPCKASGGGAGYYAEPARMHAKIVVRRVTGRDAGNRRTAVASARAKRPIFRSPPAGVANPTAEPAEVVRIGHDCLRRGRAFEKQAAQVLTVPILADQFADIFA